MKNILSGLIVLLISICVVSCDKSNDKIEPRDDKTAQNSVKNANPTTLGKNSSNKNTASNEAKNSALSNLPKRPQKLSASNILISFKDSKKPIVEVTRTKPEALEKAKEVYAKIQAGEDFAKLAGEYSDGPEKKHEGRLGVFMSNRMPPEISNTVMSLKENEISSPVESPYGYHLIKRNKVEERYIAIILVSYKGAKKMPIAITRSKEEALERANLAFAEIKKPGKIFADVVQEFSDSASKQNNGLIGRVFRGYLPKQLDEPAFKLGFSESTRPIETEEGYVILHRIKEAHIRHIMVSHVDAKRKPPEITKTKAEARKQIEEAQKKLNEGEKFDVLALTYSDCPSKFNGGDLGQVGLGIMTKGFDNVAFSLDVNQVSGIVETEFGYHIMQRLP